MQGVLVHGIDVIKVTLRAPTQATELRQQPFQYAKGMHLPQGRCDSLLPVEDGKERIPQWWCRGHVRRQTDKGAADELLRIARQTHVMALDVVKDRHDIERLIGQDLI